jgi:hypothetical protein
MNEPFDDLRRYADDLASEVSPSTARRAVRSAMSSTPRRPRRALVALVTTGLLGLSNVALAAVADPAVPGDALYGVDRAYERVVDLAGFGGPRVTERMQETGVLVERGELGLALELVQETLGKILESDDPDAEFQTLVAELDEAPGAVSELVLNDLVAVARSVGNGDATGQDVAELARQLGQRLSEERSNRPDQAGPGNNSGNDNPNSGPGNNSGNQNPGPPDESPSDTAPGATNPNRGGNQP